MTKTVSEEFKQELSQEFSNLKAMKSIGIVFGFDINDPEGIADTILDALDAAYILGGKHALRTVQELAKNG